jgi:hypothetical protein
MPGAWSDDDQPVAATEARADVDITPARTRRTLRDVQVLLRSLGGFVEEAELAVTVTSSADELAVGASDLSVRAGLARQRVELGATLHPSAPDGGHLDVELLATSGPLAGSVHLEGRKLGLRDDGAHGMHGDLRAHGRVDVGEQDGRLAELHLRPPDSAAPLSLLAGGSIDVVVPQRALASIQRSLRRKLIPVGEDHRLTGIIGADLAAGASFAFGTDGARISAAGVEALWRFDVHNARTGCARIRIEDPIVGRVELQVARAELAADGSAHIDEARGTATAYARRLSAERRLLGVRVAAEKGNLDVAARGRLRMDPDGSPHIGVVVEADARATARFYDISLPFGADLKRERTLQVTALGADLARTGGWTRYRLRRARTH